MNKVKGLTLIELLIAISIISIIVLAGFFLARSQYLKGRDARRKADIHKIQEAVEEYEKDHDCYPIPELVVCDPGNGLTPYLQKIPCDIATGSSYLYENDGLSCAKWYRIFVFLDNQSDVSIIPSIGPGGEYNFYLSSPNAPVPTPTSTPSPTSSSTPAPTPTSSGQEADFYGCRSGVCVPILWDPTRPGPECDPNYQSPDCYGQCGQPANECVDWNP